MANRSSGGREGNLCDLAGGSLQGDGVKLGLRGGPVEGDLLGVRGLEAVVHAVALARQQGGMTQVEGRGLGSRRSVTTWAHTGNKRNSSQAIASRHAWRRIRPSPGPSQVMLRGDAFDPPASLLLHSCGRRRVTPAEDPVLP